MKKISLKDAGIYAVMGLLTLLLCGAIWSFVSAAGSRLFVPTALTMRINNVGLILLYTIIYPLLWSRRQCTEMLRDTRETEEDALVKQFVRTQIIPQVAVQFLLCLLLGIAGMGQIAPISNFEMILWTVALPFPLLLSCRIAARRHIRDVLRMRKQGENTK